MLYQPWLHAHQQLISHCCSDVIELDADNFDTNVGNGESWMVEFMAPWCGACKQLKGPYAAAAKQAKGMW
jgi:thioredoxin-like negative regulator of GroEL